MVLAVDMPLVTTATVSRLLLSVEGDGAILVDERGKKQYLCAVYDVAALRAAAPSLEHQEGLSMKKLVKKLSLVEVPAVSWEARDVDTWEDLAAMRERLEG